MEDFDEYLRKRAKEEPFPIPEDYHGKVFAVCAGLEEEPKTAKRPHRAWMGWVAAVLALVIAVPNLSPTAAAAMAEIPVLGTIVEILTFRTYTYDDGHSTAEVEVPELGGSAAAEEVSQEIEKYENQLMAQFELERESIGEGYQDLKVSSKVVVNSEDWFTMRIDAVETQASSYEYSRFYHIDKKTGEIVTLGDLFSEDSDYQTVLADEVRRQMESQPEQSFFPETLATIEADQNFYWNDQGALVLVFDEYAVAAGAAGMPEFEIPAEVWKPLLRK